MRPADVLNYIVKVDGDCLKSYICGSCPLRKGCHGRFLNDDPPSREERLAMALDAIVAKEIVGEQT